MQTKGILAERLVDLATALVAADMYGSLAFAALRGPTARGVIPTSIRGTLRTTYQRVGAPWSC